MKFTPTIKQHFVDLFVAVDRFAGENDLPEDGKIQVWNPWNRLWNMKWVAVMDCLVTLIAACPELEELTKSDMKVPRERIGRRVHTRQPDRN